MIPGREQGDPPTVMQGREALKSNPLRGAVQQVVTNPRAPPVAAQTAAAVMMMMMILNIKAL